MSRLEYEYLCPLCDCYYDDRDLRKHLDTAHDKIELADLLAHVVIDNAKADLLEEIEHQ